MLRTVLLLVAALSVSSCILFDPDYNAAAFCRLAGDECDLDDDDIEDCIEDAREQRQHAREQGSDCVELLEAQDDFHACVIAEDDVDCGLFQTFPGCDDEFEELIRESIEAGGECSP